MTTARPKQQLGTAERILDIAERLVQDRGFNSVSYADIAGELGITTASLHYHFPGKAELGHALISRYAERFSAALGKIDQDLADGRAKLEAYAALYADVLRGDRMCMCGILAAEYRTLPTPMRDDVIRFFDDNQRWLSHVLSEGREDHTLAFAQRRRRRAAAPSILACARSRVRCSPQPVRRLGEISARQHASGWPVQDELLTTMPTGAAADDPAPISRIHPARGVVESAIWSTRATIAISGAVLPLIDRLRSGVTAPRCPPARSWTRREISDLAACGGGLQTGGGVDDVADRGEVLYLAGADVADICGSEVQPDPDLDSTALPALASRQYERQPTPGASSRACAGVRQARPGTRAGGRAPSPGRRPACRRIAVAADHVDRGTSRSG